MKVLIVEDDAACAEMLSDALRGMGFEVLLADNGEDADRIWCWDQTIRLVISDWLMPGTDGLELCRRIRERDHPYYTYIILLTGQGGIDARLKGFEAGADDFLTKPMHLDELAARLQIARRILAMQEELVRRSVELESLKHELESRNARLADIALTDPLTGLRNRRHFHELFEASFIHAARTDSPLTLLLLDVDAFKHYNDTYGHPAGDEVLVTVSSELRRNVRDHDFLARYGGEEFVILLPGGGPDEGIGLAERLRRCIADYPWRELPITASFGVATMGSSSPTPAMLLGQADQALYDSKRRGRNRVTHFRDLSTLRTGLSPSSQGSPDSSPVMATSSSG